MDGWNGPTLALAEVEEGHDGHERERRERGEGRATRGKLALVADAGRGRSLKEALSGCGPYLLVPWHPIAPVH